MMNKRTYIKPECILLDEHIEINLMQATTVRVDDGNNNMELGGDGEGDNVGARQGFFDEEW